MEITHTTSAKLRRKATAGRPGRRPRVVVRVAAVEGTSSGEDGSIRSDVGGSRDDRDRDVELGVVPIRAEPTTAAAKAHAPSTSARPCCSVTAALISVAVILVTAAVLVAVSSRNSSNQTTRWFVVAGEGEPSSSAPDAPLQPPPPPPPWCDTVATGLLAAGAGSVGAAAVARSVALYNAASAAVAAAAPHEHYAAAYRDQEYGYWGPQLPAWMVVHACGMAAAGTPLRSHLDVGIAYGTLAVLLAQATHNVSAAYGIDMFPILSRQLAANWNITLDLMNVELLSLLPTWRKFDAVVMTESLEHFNFQAPPTLARLRASMHPGAVLWLSTPNGGGPGYNDVANWTSLRLPPGPFPRGHVLPDVTDDHMFVVRRRARRSAFCPATAPPPPPPPSHVLQV